MRRSGSVRRGQAIPNRLYVAHNGVRFDAEEPKRLPNDREYRVVRGNGARIDAQLTLASRRAGDAVSHRRDTPPISHRRAWFVFAQPEMPLRDANDLELRVPAIDGQSISCRTASIASRRSACRSRPGISPSSTTTRPFTMLYLTGVGSPAVTGATAGS